MTHPETPEVGGEAEQPSADTNPFEDIAGEMLGEPEEEDVTEDGDGPSAESEIEEGEAEGDEPAPIAPPVSWTAEEKEEFSQLPRTLQETLTRREAERERFVQTKAQEARQARSTVEREALTVIEQVQTQTAEQLEQYAAQLAVPAPDPRLIVEDPDLYAQQLSAHQHYLAQSQQAQRAAEQARAVADQARRESIERQQAETREIILQQFPEYLDAEQGPALREKLGAVAIELGFTPEELQNPDARDILGMKKIAEWKDGYEKHKATVAKQMERVRAGKSPPPIAKPGSPRSTDQNRRARADQAFERAKNSQGSRRVEAFGDYLSNAGII